MTTFYVAVTTRGNLRVVKTLTTPGYSVEAESKERALLTVRAFRAGRQWSLVRVTVYR